MRLVIVLAGLYCLHHTDFSSPGWWPSRGFPVLDFFFLLYLVIDLIFFLFLLGHGESLRARRYAEDDLWHWLYAQSAPYLDADGRFAGGWYVLGVVVEAGLVLLAFVHAGGLLFDALLYTGL